MDKFTLGLSVVGSMTAMVVLIYWSCRALLPLAKSIDAACGVLGTIANWLVLLACLLSAGNAMVRYTLTPIRVALRNQDLAFLHPFLRLFEPLINGYGLYANGFLEGQWYLFAGMVLLGAAYTFRVNEHVRVDLVYGMVSENARHWIDLLGGVIFLMPMCLILIWFTWPWFLDSWRTGEAAQNAGGLIRWPIKLLLPVGFAILLVQGVSEIIKRAAAIRGFHQHQYAYEKPLQ